MKAMKWLMVVALGCIVSGCYHVGTPNGTRYTLGKLEVSNAAKEPAAGRYVVSEIKQRFSVDPALTLRKGEGAPVYDMEVVVKSISNGSAGVARTRDKRSRTDDGDSYNTVTFELTLTADVIITDPNKPEPVIKRTYTGAAQYAAMHDRDLPMQEALKQAAYDMVGKILDDLATVTK